LSKSSLYPLLLDCDKDRGEKRKDRDRQGREKRGKKEARERKGKRAVEYPERGTGTRRENVTRGYSEV